MAPFGLDPGAIGADPARLATDDDYELRRARTPVPTFVAEAIETHLSRIFAREVKRDGPERLRAWWADVDGCGTSIDHWMAETVAPLLLTLGQLDLCMDHPPTPDGEAIATRADVERLGLDRCLASVILPENMLWWRLDASHQRYVECLVREPADAEDGLGDRYRHWTETGSTLYDADGQVLAVTPHPFGRVPIVRVFDRRKPRCYNVGQSRYEGIAERQREYYNRDSELILSDTTQAHPLLQGPEDYVQADGTIPIGPSWLLPKKKNVQGNSASYEGFDVVDFPKEGAESIRRNKADLRDDVDRDSALVRPTGRDGVAQSGLAKMLDHADGNNRLAKIAKVLAHVERRRGRAGADRARGRPDRPPGARSRRDRLSGRLRPVHGQRRRRSDGRLPVARGSRRRVADDRGIDARPLAAALPAGPQRRAVRPLRGRDRHLHGPAGAGPQAGPRDHGHRGFPHNPVTDVSERFTATVPPPGEAP